MRFLMILRLKTVLAFSLRKYSQYEKIETSPLFASQIVKVSAELEN